MIRLAAAACAGGLALCASAATAGEVEIVAATARTGNGAYSFDVTLRHADEGWDHYADRWEVLSPEGDVLGTRELLHPHVNEQPFTRSLSSVAVPDGLDHVMIRARDKIHGVSPVLVRVDILER